MLFSDAGKTVCFVSGPAASFLPIDAASIDTTELAKWLNKKIKDFLPANIVDAAITLRYEDNAGNYYHYAHGLKNMMVIVSVLRMAIVQLSIFLSIASETLTGNNTGLRDGRTAI